MECHWWVLITAHLKKTRAKNDRGSMVVWLVTWTARSVTEAMMGNSKVTNPSWHPGVFEPYR